MPTLRGPCRGSPSNLQTRTGRKTSGTGAAGTRTSGTRTSGTGTFGAGMSGGYAYIWDVNKTFRSNFNPELSDIDPLNDDDKKELKGLIQEHFDNTSSTVANGILKNWKHEEKHFKKVMPRDFKRVLFAKKAKAVKVALA